MLASDFGPRLAVPNFLVFVFVSNFLDRRSERSFGNPNPRSPNYGHGVWGAEAQGLGTGMRGWEEDREARCSAAAPPVEAGLDDGFGFGGVSKITVSKSKIGSPCLSECRRVFTAMAAGRENPDDLSSSGNNDPSTSGGDGPEETNPAAEKITTDESFHLPDDSLLSDWRNFRANLVARGEVLVVNPNASVDNAMYKPPNRLGLKWAHPLPMPETGCALIATDKLDGVRNFERTVILLFGLGIEDLSEGPFGVIINRPFHKIKHMQRPNPDLATTFADFSVHFGGPLDASMFMVTSREVPSLQGFENIVPGICFGAKNLLDEAIELVKKGVLSPRDFRFFSGYAGWQLDQLFKEIKSGYWVVAACSSYLIGAASEDSSGFVEGDSTADGGQVFITEQKTRAG